MLFDMFGSLGWDIFEPLAVAQDSHDGVEAIEGRSKRDLLVDVEHSANQVNDKPQEPLLGILLGQCPQGDHASRPLWPLTHA